MFCDVSVGSSLFFESVSLMLGKTYKKETWVGLLVSPPMMKSIPSPGTV